MTASRADLGAGAGLGALLIVVAFTTTGGFDSSITVSAANTWTEIGLVLAGAAAATGSLLSAERARAWGAVAVALFALVCLDAALSILWSVQPDDSWQATNLTAAYFGAFLAAVALARVLPARWPALLIALAMVTVAICGYAILAKVFPASLAAADTAGRLQSPLGYWNAVGAAAVLGLPAGLWLLSLPAAARWPRVLAAPALSVLGAVLILSYSRTDAIVGVAVLAVWFAAVPGRLRTLALFTPAALAALAIVVWALGHTGLTGDGAALALRSADGHVFGIVVVVALGVAALAAFAIAEAQERVTVPEALRQRIGRALIGLVALAPVLLVVAMAASSRGLTGEISHAWHSLTNVNGVVGNGASRLGELSSSRPLYWSQGITVGEHALFKGAGALGYATARTFYTSNRHGAEHAHSYLVQTFADFGLLGLAINLALLIAWGRAAARAVAGRRSWRELSGAAATERRGLVALLLVVLGYGIASATDWIWFFPALTVPALLAAGWLAGRGPLAQPVGVAARRRPLLSRPGAVAAVAVATAAALLVAWLVWQPLRSAQAAGSAVAAAAQGNTRTAFADARDATADDPLALQPRLVLSALYQSAGDLRSARAELVDGVHTQPDNSESWLALGQFDLAQGHFGLATPSLRRAVALDRTALINTDTLGLALHSER